MEQTDLYRRISPLKNVLKLSNCKLKTLEEFLGSGRKDPFTGGELIELYHTYRREKDERLLEVLLLHNAEDILGMLSVLSMLAYPALSEAQAGAGKAELSPVQTMRERSKRTASSRSFSPSSAPPSCFTRGWHLLFRKRGDRSDQGSRFLRRAEILLSGL